MDEPISDTVRGVLDGHIVLSRALAEKNHYPAIDILSSISRLMIKITSKEHQRNAGIIKELIAAYKAHEDLISIGAYATGSNPTVDTAIILKDKIDEFLQQGIEEKYNFDEIVEELNNIINSLYQANNEETETKTLIFE